jgi:anaerobic selenocysteine-containing dehydrogenase
VLLPTTATYESEGVFVNRAGRAQAFQPARRPGLSIEELIQQETFPRTPRLAPPAGDARPAWWAIEMLRARSHGRPEARDLAGLRAQLAGRHASWEPLRVIQAGGPGSPLGTLAIEGARLGAFPEPTRLALFRVERTLGSEVLSRRSEPVRKMAGPPVALISPADAARIGAEGRVVLSLAGHTVEVAVRALRTVPEGVVLVPRDLELPAPVAQGGPVEVQSRAVEEVSR